VAIASAEIGVIDHDEIVSVGWRTVDQVREAVTYLPPELAEAAVKAVAQALKLPVSDPRRR
jgi:hypothetical protein